MNISQHAIIPIGYPYRSGYYRPDGNYGDYSNYRTTEKFYTFGCNKVYNANPVNDYGNVRMWNVSSGEVVSSSNVYLNSIRPNDVFYFNGQFNTATFITSNTSVYYPVFGYPFLIFFKDNTSAVTSLSLGNPFSPDVINDEEILL